MTTLEWAVALPPAPCTGPCLVATPALEPGAEPEPWSQTLSSTGQRSWASATPGAAAVANVEGGDCRGRGSMAGPPSGLPWENTARWPSTQLDHLKT